MPDVCTIYALFDPATEELRYIGKTTKSLGTRLSQHIYDSRHGVRNHRNCWIRSVCTPMIRVLVVVPNDLGSETEQRIIAFYKANGCRLVNATDGGEGNVGLKHSEETRAKLREAHRKRPRQHSVETRAKMSASLKGHNTSRGSASPLYGKPRSAEVRAKISAAKKGRYSNLPVTETTSAKLRQAALKKWAKWRDERAVMVASDAP